MSVAVKFSERVGKGVSIAGLTKSDEKIEAGKQAVSSGNGFKAVLLEKEDRPLSNRDVLGRPGGYDRQGRSKVLVR